MPCSSACFSTWAYEGQSTGDRVSWTEHLSECSDKLSQVLQGSRKHCTALNTRRMSCKITENLTPPSCSCCAWEGKEGSGHRQGDTKLDFLELEIPQLGLALGYCNPFSSSYWDAGCWGADTVVAKLNQGKGLDMAEHQWWGKRAERHLRYSGLKHSWTAPFPRVGVQRSVQRWD